MAETLVSRVKKGWKSISRGVKLTAAGLFLSTVVATTAVAQTNTQVNVHVEDKKQASVENVFTKIGQGEVTHDSTWTDYNGNGTLTIATVGVVNDPYTPLTFSLSQNYPNPWNPSTTIHFSTTDKGYFVIYDLLGREVAGGEEEGKIPGAGRYTARWGGANDNGLNVASGIYFYSVITPDEIKTKKMILLGGGSGGKLGISGTAQQVNRSLGRITNNQYQLSFEKDNMTNLLLPVIINGDTTINAEVNVGPTVLDTIPNQLLNVGDTMQVNMDDFVYNDETGLYLPRDSANFDVEENIVSYIAVQPETLSTWIDIVDGTDSALRDSLFLRVLVPYIATPLAFDLPSLIEINEDSDIDTLLANLNDYVLPAGQDVAFNLLSQSNPGLVNLILNNYSVLVDSLRQNGYGESMFSINASNADTTVTDSTLLRVLGVNDAPVFIGTVPNYTVSQDSSLLIPASTFFSDVDGDTLDYIIQNLSNASQTSENGIVTVTPSAGWNGTLSGLVLEAADAEYTAQSNEFGIDVEAPPMVDITFLFKAAYPDTFLTSGVNVLTWRQMLADTSGYVGELDSVIVTGYSITRSFPEGTLFDINGKNSESADNFFPERAYTFIRKGADVLEQRSYQDEQSPLTFTQDDTLEIRKMMDWTQIYGILDWLDHGEGTRRFTNGVIPVWWNTSGDYMEPSAAMLDITNATIDTIMTWPYVNGAIEYQVMIGDTAPEYPYVELVRDPNQQTPVNYTWSNDNNEIRYVQLTFPASFTSNEFKGEFWEGTTDSYEIGGNSAPAISGGEFTEWGRTYYSLNHIGKPKTTW
ncbi:T9SS type A sorting domain-containing protein [Candidatus Woesearchaeota archaeon]|nr:T9SS type A sorting domain-containing protein [Candidatus Woesearchaeota archaeon]